MKRYTILILCLLLSILTLSQGRYITRAGVIEFLSETPIENIHAVNNNVSCIFDPRTGDIAFQLRVVSFKFEKALMQEHFNEKYMESEKYPKSTFVGKIEEWDPNMIHVIDEQVIKVSGNIMIHGVEQSISCSGLFFAGSDSISLTSTFSVDPKDFNIKIPKIVRKNIADVIEIGVEVEMKHP